MEPEELVAAAAPAVKHHIRWREMGFRHSCRCWQWRHRTDRCNGILWQETLITGIGETDLNSTVGYAANTLTSGG